jgi:hypothetical protein
MHFIAPNDAKHLPLRDLEALALDDEDGFAWFHAHTAYRFGLRAHVLTTSRNLRRFSGGQAPQNETDAERNARAGAVRSSYPLVASFEDLYFRLADVPKAEAQERHLSLIEWRDREFPILHDLPCRVIVTIGERRGAQSRVDGSKQVKPLSSILDTLRDKPAVKPLSPFSQAMRTRLAEVVHKPYSGMFGIWIKSGLAKALASDGFLWDCGSLNPVARLRWFPTLRPALRSAVTETFGWRLSPDTLSRIRRTSFYDSSDLAVKFCHRVGSSAKSLVNRIWRWAFCFPLRHREWTERPTSSDSHSAHARLRVIAESLIERARHISQKTDDDPLDLLTGAILACDARELLGDRPPTTSVEAISLQHRLECLTDSCFRGVGHNFELDRRFQEIEREVECAASVLPRDRFTEAKLTWEIGILNELVLVFRNANQFDEEHLSLARVRHLNRAYKLNRAHNLDRNHWAIIPFLMRTYMDSLLGGKLLLWLPFWFLLWGTVFLLACTNEPTESLLTDRIDRFVLHPMIACFGLQPPHEKMNLRETLATIAAIPFGVFHLGILVSYLYSKISRR